MHEYHIVESIVKEAIASAKKSNALKVTKIVLVRGELSGLEESSLRMYFEELSKGTLLEGALIEFKTSAAKLKCKDCGELFERKEKEFSCPKCCAMNLVTESGKEFYIASMEIESP